MGLVLIVFSGFALALPAPWLIRRLPRAGAFVLAALPAGIVAYLLFSVPTISDHASIVTSYEWAPSLGLQLAFRLDGLSLLFALIISGIGTLILVYAGPYMAHHPLRGRFFGFMLMFMASMLGLVLADNLLVLYVFWELTSVSSWLLIGFEHEEEQARRAAWQAFLVTSGSGLAMLAGFVLLGQIGGSYDISLLSRHGDEIRSHSAYHAILMLVLVGAFAKSAQFPFHFWIPNAMEAPTPVSAYLHSATMVKAGIYLMLRLTPSLAGTDAWFWTVTAVGTASMLAGAALAVIYTDMKRVLAYTTIGALGMIVLMIGLGTEYAIKAALLLLLAHSLYKSALFMVAGVVSHETGTRDIDELRGLWRVMPYTSAAAFLALFSMISLPPSLGFVSHEEFFKAARKPEFPLGIVLTFAAVAASTLYTTAGCLIVLRPFLGGSVRAPAHPKRAPVGMWLSAATAAALGLVGVLLLDRIGSGLIAPAASVPLGYFAQVHLVLWHGFTAEFWLGVAALVAGLLLYFAMPGPRRHLGVVLTWFARIGPDRMYQVLIDGTNSIAKWQTRVLQNGSMPIYVLLAVSTLVSLVGYPFVKGLGHAQLVDKGATLSQALVGAIAIGAAFGTVLLSGRIAVLVCMGVVGYSVAIFFAMFAAPDLAIIQFLVETLFVILAVLALRHIKDFRYLDSRREILRDATIALTLGTLVALLLASIAFQPPSPELPNYFAANSKTQAHGRNIVNVILVDFRALDTLGEITVLSVAAMGMYVLLKLKVGK